MGKVETILIIYGTLIAWLGWIVNTIQNKLNNVLAVQNEILQGKHKDIIFGKEGGEE